MTRMLSVDPGLARNAELRSYARHFASMPVDPQCV